MQTEHRITPTRLRPVMLAGTGSDVGKSVIATALCRIFVQDGYHPAPFKAQNMALNSYVTADGLELGRAQAVQAEAARVPCHTDMNPLLLKPQSDHTSQVVLLGRPVGNRSAYDYFRREGREELQQVVCQAFDRLAARYNPIVMEGAGSISEINLRDSDIVNLPMALYAGADVILVADIDRGGVFASVYGTMQLLRPHERRCMKGIIINKFRGDIRLFESGVKMLEKLCGIPVLGVVPYYKDIYVEEEDSVALATKSYTAQRGRVNVAVVLLRHLSNFTDFNVLERDPRVHLFYTNNVDELLKADIILLPGSKSTIDDLCELRRNGVAQAIIRARREGATVMGICGGYQLMGQEVTDPEHVEGDIERLPGLGLLPIRTRISGEKRTRQVRCSIASQGDHPHPDAGCTAPGVPPAVFGQGYAPSITKDMTGTEDLWRTVPQLQADPAARSLCPEHSEETGAEPSSTFPCAGYEIHNGRTTLVEGSPSSPLLLLEDGTTDGYLADPACMGTYVHGILDNPAFIDFLLSRFADRLAEATKPFDYQAFKDEQYDRLADHVRASINLPLLYQILNADHD